MSERENTRRIAGDVVRDEIARRGLMHSEAAEMFDLSRSTLAKILAGKAGVPEGMLRKIEGSLAMPRRLLSIVIEGDADEVARMRFEDADLQRDVLHRLRRGGAPD